MKWIASKIRLFKSMNTNGLVAMLYGIFGQERLSKACVISGYEIETCMNCSRYIIKKANSNADNVCASCEKTIFKNQCMQCKRIIYFSSLNFPFVLSDIMCCEHCFSETNHSSNLLIRYKRPTKEALKNAKQYFKTYNQPAFIPDTETEGIEFNFGTDYEFFSKDHFHNFWNNVDMEEIMLYAQTQEEFTDSIERHYNAITKEYAK